MTYKLPRRFGKGKGPRRFAEQVNKMIDKKQTTAKKVQKALSDGI